jgi:hypothetical protein
MKWIMVLLGLGLAMLGAAGIDRSVGVVAWMDIALAIIAVLIGVTVRAHPHLQRAPLVIGSALAVITLAGTTTRCPFWILGWNLLFVVGFLLDGTLALRSTNGFRPSRA